MGPVAPPDITSGADLAKEPFEQMTGGGGKHLEFNFFGLMCDPCPQGRYLYIYANSSTPSTIKICNAELYGESRSMMHNVISCGPTVTDKLYINTAIFSWISHSLWIADYLMTNGGCNFLLRSCGIGLL